jgi:homocysteine S-methyltransferase
MKIKYPLLIDGGLSNELERLGCNLNHKLWSANMLDADPESIIQAHLSYLHAGANCIITSSYQATVPGFMSLGYSKEKAESLIMRSVDLAAEAINRFKTTENSSYGPLIAASIGPYGAYLADGSEYLGNYGLSDSQLRDFHISRIDILDRSGADFLAIETIPSFHEVKILADIISTTKKTAWFSFSCRDDQHINDGTPIKECVCMLADHPNVFAIGANCTAPNHISGLIRTIKSESESIKIVVYPNSGEAYNADSKTWLGLSDPGLFLEMAKEWLKLGADIIGGCCRIGPEHINRMSNILI